MTQLLFLFAASVCLLYPPLFLGFRSPTLHLFPPHLVRFPPLSPFFPSELRRYVIVLFFLHECSEQFFCLRRCVKPIFSPGGFISFPFSFLFHLSFANRSFGWLGVFHGRFFLEVEHSPQAGIFLQSRTRVPFFFLFLNPPSLLSEWQLRSQRLRFLDPPFFEQKNRRPCLRCALFDYSFPR